MFMLMCLFHVQIISYSNWHVPLTEAPFGYEPDIPFRVTNLRISKWNDEETN